jgi:hypothetical protein
VGPRNETRNEIPQFQRGEDAGDEDAGDDGDTGDDDAGDEDAGQ